MRGATTALVLGMAAVVAAPAALARDHREVVRTGSCSAGATAALTLDDDDGRIEVEFEVDQNRSGVPWRVSVTRNGATVFSGTRTTRAPSGSFSVERTVRDLRGADVVRARAIDPSGQVCRLSATWR